MFELLIPIQVFCKSTEKMPESQNTHTNKGDTSGSLLTPYDCYLLLENSILKTRGLGQGRRVLNLKSGNLVSFQTLLFLTNMTLGKLLHTWVCFITNIMRGSDNDLQALFQFYVKASENFFYMN